jgi:hypothetical protein
MKLETFLQDLGELRFKRITLSVSASALIGASGHKAMEYAQAVWGNAEGAILIGAGAVAAFFALHTAFNANASKPARFWAACAALALGLLEGGAIMQGNISKAAVVAQDKYAGQVSQWDAQKAGIDTAYQQALDKWEADKAQAETEAGKSRQALREELASVKDALAENAASQRKTKASSKDGNVTQAYQSLLDQQASLLARSGAINAELGKPLQLGAAPASPVYPTAPAKPSVSLAPVEYAQSFAFPALVVVLMFLRGRRDEEDAALAELVTIQQQADAITHKLGEAIGKAEQRIAGLLSGISGEGQTSVQQIRQAASAELDTLRQQLAQLQQTASETVRNADVAARAISQRTAHETETDMANRIKPLLDDAKVASSDLQKQVVQANAVLAKGTVPALHPTAPGTVPALQGQCTGTVPAVMPTSAASAQWPEKLPENDALNLLRLQQVQPNENGLITSEVIQANTGYGRKLSDKLRNKAIAYGYLVAETHGIGNSCRYPDSIQPDRHTLPEGPDKSNVITLAKRGQQHV